MKKKQSILSKHQRKVFYWQRDKQHVGYFLEMRLGKTRLTIKSVMASACYPCLIFCPYSAIYGWEQELLKCGVSNNQFITLKGIKKERLRWLNFQDTVIAKLSIPKFVITNRESHLSVGKEIANINWRSVVLDESTCIKNYKTQISRYFTENFRSAKRRFILSGTPAPENELDYYQQIKFLNPEIFPEARTHYQFKSKYFVQTYYGWEATKQAKNIISKRISQHCYIMSRKDAGLGNRKIYERKYFKLKKDTMRSYKKFVKNFILEYEEKIYKVTDYSIVQYTFLRQLCSGFLKDPETDKYEFIDDSKLKLLLELITTELLNSQIIMWCSFIEEIHLIYKHLQNRAINCERIYGGVKQNKRSEIVERFQNREITILIAHPACFKYGTTLNKADTTIFFSSPLGYETRSQSEARMNNPFLKEPDLIIDLIAEKTLEEKIIESLVRKESRQHTSLQIIKHLQEINNE